MYANSRSESKGWEKINPVRSVFFFLLLRRPVVHSTGVCQCKVLSYLFKKKTILCTKILRRKYYVHHWRDIISAYIGKIKLFPWHPLLPWSQISKNTVVLIYRLLSVRSTSVPFPLASNWGAVCQIWSNSVLCDHEKQLKILFFWPTNGCNLCSVCVCAELGPVLNNSLLISPCHSTFRFCIHSLRCLQ